MIEAQYCQRCDVTYFTTFNGRHVCSKDLEAGSTKQHRS